MKKFEKKIKAFICLRCSHLWKPRSTNKPVACPKCKSPYWDRPRKE